MSVLNLLLILLVLSFFGAIPVWPYNHSWGYFPSGLLLLLVIVIAFSALSGRAKV